MEQEKKGNFFLRFGDIRNMTSVKKKIQKVVIAIVVLAMFFLGMISSALNYYSTMDSLKQSMGEMAIVAAGRVEWQITAYKNIIQELGRTARLANDNYTIEEKQVIIDEKVNAYNCIRGKLIGLDGIAEIDGTDYSEREYFQKAIKGETYLSEPLIAKTDGQLSLILAAPVWEGGIPDTTVVGVVFLSVQPDLLDQIVKDIYVSENNGAYIINRHGTTVAHTTDGMVESQNNTIENAKTDASLKEIAALEQKMIAGESGYGTYKYHGQSKFLAYAPIANSDGWSIGINAPIMDFMGTTFLGIGITVVVAVIFILLASYMAVKVGNHIGEPIRQCADRLNCLMQGDLQSPLPEIHLKDEVGILAGATKGITDGLNNIIGDIGYLLEAMANGDFTVSTKARESYVGDYEKILLSLRKIRNELGSALSAIHEVSEQVTTGANQLSENAQSLAEGATEQASSVEELTANIENVTRISEESAKNAKHAYELVDVAVTEAKSGEQAMTQLTQAMNRITETSQEIQNIITAIEDIASQTNLLSLNASIEAARAGEAGKGFAVVAEQIGKLAADSAQSAVDTRELIVKVLEEIETGNKITGTSAGVFEKVSVSMKQFSELAHGASSASDQQAAMLEQVEAGVEQIAGVVQSNSASAQETSATSEELSAQAENMNELVRKFQF